MMFFQFYILALANNFVSASPRDSDAPTTVNPTKAVFTCKDSDKCLARVTRFKQEGGAYVDKLSEVQEILKTITSAAPLLKNSKELQEVATELISTLPADYGELSEFYVDSILDKLTAEMTKLLQTYHQFMVETSWMVKSVMIMACEAAQNLGSESLDDLNTMIGVIKTEHTSQEKIHEELLTCYDDFKTLFRRIFSRVLSELVASVDRLKKNGASPAIVKSLVTLQVKKLRIHLYHDIISMFSELDSLVKEPTIEVVRNIQKQF